MASATVMPSCCCALSAHRLGTVKLTSCLTSAALCSQPTLAQDAVEAVGRILGMQACEGTDAVPPNARSHTLLLSGTVVGDVQVGGQGGGVQGGGRVRGTVGAMPEACMGVQ